MRVFNISKKKWLRGETNIDSYLLRSSDRKMCCIGQVLEQLGCPAGELEGVKEYYSEDYRQYGEQISLGDIVENTKVYRINDTPTKYKRPWDRIRALNRALTRVGASWRMRLVP